MSFTSTIFVGTSAIAIAPADVSAIAIARATLRVGACIPGRFARTTSPAEKLAVFAAHLAASAL